MEALALSSLPPQLSSIAAIALILVGLAGIASLFSASKLAPRPAGVPSLLPQRSCHGPHAPPPEM